MRKHIHHLFVVLPFEKQYFEERHMPVSFYGHPLLDQISQSSETREVFRRENNLNEKPIIALLPGSRKQEILSMLPVMLEMCSRFPNHQFVIAGAPSQPKSFYTEIIGSSAATLLSGQTSEILRHAEVGLITSGTATLEAGIYRLPQVVCYKGSVISYAIAKRLVKIKYISLVNLVLNRKAVTETAYFGSADYGQEELVAEMASAFVCGHCGIEQAILDNSAAYIAAWLRTIKQDSKLVVVAAAQAQKAADYILGDKAVQHEAV